MRETEDSSRTSEFLAEVTACIAMSFPDKRGHRREMGLMKLVWKY